MLVRIKNIKNIMKSVETSQNINDRRKSYKRPKRVTLTQQQFSNNESENINTQKYTSFSSKYIECKNCLSILSAQKIKFPQMKLLQNSKNCTLLSKNLSNITIKINKNEYISLSNPEQQQQQNDKYHKDILILCSVCSNQLGYLRKNQPFLFPEKIKITIVSYGPIIQQSITVKQSKTIFDCYMMLLHYLFAFIKNSMLYTILEQKATPTQISQKIIQKRYKKFLQTIQNMKAFKRFYQYYCGKNKNYIQK